MTRRALVAGSLVAGAFALVIAIAIVVSPGAPGPSGPAPSTGPIVAPIGSALPDVPSPTVPPTNTALPLPQGAGAVAVTSAPVSPPPAPRSATPTPDPAVWRFEGRVVDESGASLDDVCVVIGPRGCQRVSPHTDE